MAIEEPRVGEIIPYWFLWRSEHEAGEDAGRKLRPCVVVVALRRQGNGTRVAVVPMTHTLPDATRAAIEVPAQVKAYLGLDERRSWIICDEFNEFDWPGMDLGKAPNGTFSFGLLPRGLLSAIRDEMLAARARGKLHGAARDG